MKIKATILAFLATSSLAAGRDGFWGDADQKADKKHSRGLQVPANWPTPEASFGAFAIPRDPTAIPRTFRWDTHVPIRDQGDCGSCWAFATTAIVESLNTLTGMGHYDLSEQSTLDCSRAGSCQGGFFEALNYLTYPGAAAEVEYPYLGRDNICPNGLLPVSRLFSWAYVGERGREPTLEELKLAIYYYGPIAVAVNGSFGDYQGGVFDKCTSDPVDHMVNIEGWDDKKGAWLVRNSWGTSWGEQGWAWVKYQDSTGKKCNGIGSIAAYAVLSRPLKVQVHNNG